MSYLSVAWLRQSTVENPIGGGRSQGRSGQSSQSVDVYALRRTDRRESAANEQKQRGVAADSSVREKFSFRGAEPTFNMSTPRYAQKHTQQYLEDVPMANLHPMSRWSIIKSMLVF